MTSQVKTTAVPTPLQFNILTLAAAITAAIAATTAASVGWPVWAMFMGWVAFFTRGHTAKDALFSYLCLAIGVAFGMGAALGLGALLPLIGPFAFGPVVFVVAIVVVSLRGVPHLNNVPSYFLGLITFFAAHLEPGVLAFSELAAVSGLGSLAAWFAHTWQTKIARR
jgi:amino acid permease